MEWQTVAVAKVERIKSQEIVSSGKTIKLAGEEWMRRRKRDEWEFISRDELKTRRK